MAATHVLTFGCARTQKMYRALVPGPVPSPMSKKTTLVVIPTCPGCGAEHAIPDTFGRPFRPGDEIDVSLAGFVPVSPDDAPPVPPLVTHERGVPKMPDADMLAAIPTDRQVLAADVARALGYSLTFTLMERIERLNARALRTWGHPAVRIIKTETGRCPTYLQRIEHQPTNKEAQTTT